MNGLSIYLTGDMTDEKIEDANAFASALEEEKTATVSEIQKRASPKASSQLDFRTLLDRQKKYANLLQALFGRKFPLLQELVRDMIVPLQKLVWSSKSLMRTTTLAAINLAVFRQGCSFALEDYHFSTTSPTYSLFPAVRIDSRISHKSGSISPPETKPRRQQK